MGEDNSVKLGDFGLSKIMASHDFASTYVGTPFYMSPEICAAERYTLKSDIWSLGCIIYELCSREPPFNAKTHFQLVQRIKEGRVAPIPSVYSPALMTVIKDCLKVNPDRRPDTATLLNLPPVKLMRKEKEVVELGRLLKTKEEKLAQQQREMEKKLVDERQEIDDSVRREWEVRARLEINRQVHDEMEVLRKQFDIEVQQKVEAALRQQSQTTETKPYTASTKDFSASESTTYSSAGTSDGDITADTDLTSLSLDSPEPSKALKKSTRTPFGRAQTMFAGTPMDVEMGEPSPMSIASLSLSPRRGGAAKAPLAGRNIFAAAAASRPEERWRPTLINSDDEDDDDDDTPVLPSPTRQKGPSRNPFKSAAGRPPLISQKTAPIQKLGSQAGSQSNIFSAATASSAAKAVTTPNLTTLSSQPELRPSASNAALRDKASTSPSRRLSKIPSSSSLLASYDGAPSPTRKTSLTRKAPGLSGNSDDLSKMAMKNNLVMKSNMPLKGRTLVELTQARAGGRPVDANGDVIVGAEGNGSPKGKRLTARMAEREKEPIVWDPERDEMPSPFLVRKRDHIRRV